VIIDQELYVEHYGKKGMHWGVRNTTPRTKEQQQKRDKRVKTAKKVAVGVGGGALAIGAAFALRHFALKKGLKVADAELRADTFNKSKLLFDRSADIKINTINRFAKNEGINSLSHPKAESVWKKIDAVNTERDNKVTLARLNAMTQPKMSKAAYKIKRKGRLYP
jgi:hypothetical protein